MDGRKRKITDFFNKIEGNSNNTPSTSGGSLKRPSEHSVSALTSDSSGKKGVTYSRGDTCSSVSSAKDTTAKIS